MSCSYRTFLINLVLFTAILQTSCWKETHPAIERVGIVSFDNLTGDSRWNWLSAAAPQLWKAQILGTPKAVAQVLHNTAEAPQMGATTVLTGYFSIRNGELRATVNLTATDTGKARRTIFVQAKDPVSLLTQISAQLELPLRPMPTQNVKAMEAFGYALQAPSIPQAISFLTTSTTVDPAFGLAWIELIDQKRLQGDAQGVIESGKMAVAQKAIPQLELAEISLRSLPADASPVQRLTALEAVARQYPADGQSASQVANFAVAARLLPKAVEWYRIATDILPDSPQLWNSKAYAEAFAGEFASAQKSIERYRILVPEDPNTFDSFGEILYLQGKFAEAEVAFLAGFAKQPEAFGGAMMRKGAWSRLRAGDLAGANKIYSQFIAFRKSKNDPFVPLREAQWLYLTGHHADAKTRLLEFANQSKSPVTWAQLSIWERKEGNQPKASEYAQKAIQALPAAPQQRNAVAIAALLAQPNASAEVWKQRMNGQPIAAIGMLASNQFSEAAQFLEQVRTKMNPLQESYWKDLHAIALYRAGNKDAAKALLKTYSLPETEEDGIVLCFAYPADQQIRRELAK